MASFEQNQQNQFNMNNSLDQIKQWQTEIDKATASIGTAELEAEEELLGIRLKNLSKSQQTKLTQLGQMLELEEKGIQELAKLKLTLSNRQFAIRKKEIQKELQLYKAAAEELFKAEGKHKGVKPESTSKKPSSATNDLKASTKSKPADIAIQKADRKVQSATYSVDMVRQEITDAVSSIQELAATSIARTEMPKAQQSQSTKNTPAIASQTTAPTQREYTDNSSGFEKVDLGKELFDSVLNKFDAALKADNKPNKAFIDALDKIIANGGEKTSQHTLDLANSLLDNFEEAEKAVRKLREFNENKIQNIRLLQLTEEQRLKQVHAQTSFNNTIAKINAYTKQQDIALNADAYRKEEISKLSIEHLNKENALALEKLAAEEKAKDLIHNKVLYLAEAQDKLTTGHATKQNQLKLAAMDSEAKANDLITNKQLYELEAREARENAFADTKNKLTEELIAAEENKKYDIANKQELLDQEVFKLRVDHAEADHKARLDLISAEAKAKDLEYDADKYRSEAKQALELKYIQEQNKLTEDLYKTETGIAYAKAHKAELLTQEESKLRNEHTAAYQKYLLDTIAVESKEKDLELNRRKYFNEELHNLEVGHKTEQNKLTQDIINAEARATDLELNSALYLAEEESKLRKTFAEEENRLTEELLRTQAGIDFANLHSAELREQASDRLRNEHEAARQKAIMDNITAQAKAEDIENNRKTYLDEATDKLNTEHIEKQNQLRLAAINREAKARELIENEDHYILEARLAHENAFYEERNRLEEERIRAAEEIDWNAANRDKLIAQEEQKTRLNYLAEYQKLQADGFSHLTENMTAAAFEALRAETEATEKAIADRAKTRAAFDKAFAAQKAKGTLAEKNQLIKAIVKERAAEKDWSQARDKFQITDDMDEQQKAQAQKARELAVRTEMLITGAMASMANFAQQLNAQTDKIGARQAPIDTRLQGSTANDKLLGSYWKQLARDMNKIGAVNPYFKQEDFASNIEALVNRGIAYDVKQRAFLMTIQEKIANTFDAADGTLLRLIRIQQQDTTAGRLGMESALNSFLNSMYETSEYLTDVASSVRSSLGEMQALMDGAAGTELEFQVQKWMGSLYSVGMSQEAVQNIAQAFGQIASGDISGLTGSGTSNLLIMAANEAGMSIADILQDGLNAKETNTLMQAMVNYLAEIAETSSDSRVVQQQLANVYGVKASDLRAATNLASSIKDVSKQDLTYSGMLGQLKAMANSMALRTSIGEMSSNVWDNFQYTMATQMANDPMLYLLPRVATLLEDYAGGIDLPFVNAMGFGVDLNTSVAQLMNVAAMSGTILGSLGPMISGLSSAISGSTMLSLAGINTSGKVPVIARGSVQPLQHLGGSSISESGYIGNASGSDIKNATLQDAADSKKKLLVEAKDEESADDTVIRSQQAIIDIYNLLEEVAHGSQSLRVRVVNNIGAGGFGGAGGAGGSGSSGGGSSDLTSATPSDGVGSSGGYGRGGADNGNWVLTF